MNSLEYLVRESQIGPSPGTVAPALPAGCALIRPVAEVRNPPFRYICAIEDRSSGSWQLIGAGTLVGPSTVLTAAHHVFGRTPGDLRVRVARSGRSSLASRRVLAGTTFPGFTDLGMTGFPEDVAILELRTPVPSTVGFWGRVPRPSFDSRGSTIGSIPGWRPGSFSVNFSGYPLAVDRGVQRHCYTPTLLDVPGTPMLAFRSGCVRGHSGGPVWVTRDRSLGGRHLFGIVVDFDPGAGECTAVHLTGSNRDLMAFIKRHVTTARFAF